MFEWDQTLEEVNMYIKLPPNVHPKQFYCKIQSKHVEIGIKGNPPYLNVSLIAHVSFSIALAVFLFYLFIVIFEKFFNSLVLQSQHELTSPVKTDSSFWTLGIFSLCH